MTSLPSALAKAQFSAVSAVKPPQAKLSPMEPTSKSSPSNVHSLAALWARKYYIAVTEDYDAQQAKKSQSLKEATSREGRACTVEKLMKNLNLASARAWSKTETLLSDQVHRHCINPELINPLEIAADTRYLFQKVLNAYTERVTAQRVSVFVGGDFGQVRQKYTSVDPRAIGFVSMQFHYTGQMLLQWLSSEEQMLWMPYLKMMDDHMYMPLKAAYEAAAKHNYDSPNLVAVQHLLPLSTRIARNVCNQVCRQHPSYHTHSGSLNDLAVKTASIRDAEMFQVYLCLSTLQKDMAAVQRELFPLCVMLYPSLKVKWRLVQDMLQAMGWEMHKYLPPDDVASFLPYLRSLTEMFSNEVFQTS